MPEYVQIFFEVFIGWRITVALVGILFTMYGVPLLVPEMSATQLSRDCFDPEPLVLALLGRLF